MLPGHWRNASGWQGLVCHIGTCTWEERSCAKNGDIREKGKVVRIKLKIQLLHHFSQGLPLPKSSREAELILCYALEHARGMIAILYLYRWAEGVGTNPLTDSNPQSIMNEESILFHGDC